MKVLILAPQPFFQERGTPIAVKLAGEALAERNSLEVEILCYPEGDVVMLPNVRIRRFWTPSFVRGIRPGISVGKILSDCFMLFAFFRLLWRCRRSQFDLVHAVEESVFMALFAKIIFRIPYVYDMDSSLPRQLVARWPWSAPLFPVFKWMEAVAVRNAIAVIAVCSTLAGSAREMGARSVHLLSDVSLLEIGERNSLPVDLRKECGVEAGEIFGVYVGNLEPYQGIDLLLESLAFCKARGVRFHVGVVGGREEHIRSCLEKCAVLGISDTVHFTGPKAVSLLGGILEQADILLSPRIRGTNTPMKIYSYLHAGKPVLATDLETHTQVLNDSISVLAAPNPVSFGGALADLALDAARREALGREARAAAETSFTLPAFRRTLNAIYDQIEEDVRLSSSQ